MQDAYVCWCAFKFMENINSFVSSALTFLIQSAPSDSNTPSSFNFKKSNGKHFDFRWLWFNFILIEWISDEFQLSAVGTVWCEFAIAQFSSNATKFEWQENYRIKLLRLERESLFHRIVVGPGIFQELWNYDESTFGLTMNANHLSMLNCTCRTVCFVRTFEFNIKFSKLFLWWWIGVEHHIKLIQFGHTFRSCLRPNGYRQKANSFEKQYAKNNENVSYLSNKLQFSIKKILYLSWGRRSHLLLVRRERMFFFSTDFWMA